MHRKTKRRRSGQLRHARRAGPGERIVQRRGEVVPFGLAQEASQHDPFAVAAYNDAFRITFGRGYPRPIGVEPPGPRRAIGQRAPDQQRAGRDLNVLAQPRGAEIQAEGDIDRQHVETEEAEYGPCAHQCEGDPGGEADHANEAHQDEKAVRTQTAVGPQHGIELQSFAFEARLRLLACHAPDSTAGPTAPQMPNCRRRPA